MRENRAMKTWALLLIAIGPMIALSAVGQTPVPVAPHIQQSMACSRGQATQVTSCPT